jgi:hypothetical protein
MFRRFTASIIDFLGNSSVSETRVQSKKSTECQLNAFYLQTDALRARFHLWIFRFLAAASHF